MKTAFYLIIFSLFLLSCKKEKPEQNISFPLTIYSNSLDIKSSFKLYTNGSEINNITIKNRFKSKPEFYSLENQQINLNENLIFLSKDTAVFGNSDTKYAVVKSGDQFLFYSPLTVLGSSNSIIYDIIKYNSPKIPIPFQNGYDYLTKEVRVANGNYQNLKLSILSYLLKRGNNSFSSVQSGVLFNEFNTGIISKLTIQDTLAIQEYTLTLKTR